MIDWKKKFETNWIDDGFGGNYNELYATFYQCFFRLLDTGKPQRLFYVVDYKQRTCRNGIDADLNYIEYDSLVETGYMGDYPLADCFRFEKFTSKEHAPTGENAFSGSIYANENDYYCDTFTMFDLSFDKSDAIYQFYLQAAELGLTSNNLFWERKFSVWYEFVYCSIDDEDASASLTDKQSVSVKIPDKERKLYEKFNTFLTKEMKQYVNDVGVLREGRELNPAIIKKLS